MGTPYEHLPPLPNGFEYQDVELNGQHYVTTGGFRCGDQKRTINELAYVGCLVLDFDLVDWAARQHDWPTTDTDATKKLMYAHYLTEDGKASTPQRLADLARFRDDAMACIEEATQAIPGGCMPTYVVNTGWGIHCYFWLKDAAKTRADILRARTLNRALVERVNAAAGYDLCDPSVHDCGTRLLRPLWTENYPSLNTKAAPFSVKIKLNEELSTKSVWDIAQSQQIIDGMPELVEVKAPRSRAACAPGEEPAVGVLIDFDQTEATEPTNGDKTADKRIMSNLIAYLSKDKGTKKLFDALSNVTDGKVAEADGEACADKSSVTMHVAVNLAGRNLPHTLIALIIEAIRSDKKHSREWFVKTAMKACRRVKGSAGSAAEDYSLIHESVAVELNGRMPETAVVNAVVRRDPRISAAIWVNKRTGTPRWSGSEAGKKAHTSILLESLDMFPSVEDRDVPFADADYTILLQWIDRVYGTRTASSPQVYVPVLYAALRAHDPVKDYLIDCVKGLPANANADLLETWLIRAFGLPDTKLTRVLSRKWVIGGAARGLNPGVFIKSMLTLISDQSAGKSSMLRILGGDYYVSPDTKDLGSKDTKLQCQEAWLMEMEEMDFMGRNTSESIKTYITTTIDKIRRPYGRVIEEFPRGCFYAATGNRSTFLRDTTGNDRYWPIDLGSSKCDFEFVHSIRNTLWGLAAKAWLDLADCSHKEKNAAINLTLEELEELRLNNDKFMDKDECTESVLEETWRTARLRHNAAADKFLFVSAEELCGILGNSYEVNFNKLKKQTQLRLTTVLEGAGFKNGQPRRADGTNRRKWVAPKHWYDRFIELTAEFEMLTRANPGKHIEWPKLPEEEFTILGDSKPDAIPDLGLSSAKSAKPIELPN